MFLAAVVLERHTLTGVLNSSSREIILATRLDYGSFLAAFADAADVGHASGSDKLKLYKRE